MNVKCPKSSFTYRDETLFYCTNKDNIYIIILEIMVVKGYISVQ